MNVRIDLNEPKILAKVQNDRFGLLVSNEWKRLIDPYTPYRTGKLIGVTGQTVDELPFKLHYKATYASYVYFSNGWNFYKEKSPYATDHWDIKAANAGQLDKLTRTLNNALQSGQY